MGDDGRIVSVTVKVTRNEFAIWKAEAAEIGMPYTVYLLEPRRKELQRKQREQRKGKA